MKSGESSTPGFASGTSQKRVGASVDFNAAGKKSSGRSAPKPSKWTGKFKMRPFEPVKNPS